jgi:hypothetical protein
MNFMVKGAEKKMRSTRIYAALAAVMICSTGCKKESERPTYFSTPQEAANKAKSDLLAVLRSNKELTLGLQEQTIENSQPATPIKQYQITFENLSSADSFTALQQNELATVVPLMANDTVATVVEVAKDETGWKAASLADKGLSNELDVVRKTAGSQAQIVVYDLPHSGSKVYGVTQSGAGEAAAMFYTNYPGFNLREAAPADSLLAVLKQDAAEFQRKYGEELKSRKLVR